MLINKLLVGRQNSVTHSQLIDVLEDAGFISQEFILTPLQLGIPYSRPRYFCLVGIVFCTSLACDVS
jgi:tRNA (cytosine38-C5)-methyltransferase